ncbi:T9SS type A sorting domain-containing protein [Maribacter aurantiacus]|uniref:T9SS type A sorting domain-containing protein n=1 Tax=Maribacter aurantiacus TaxID=1882343 RepID=A0A5R8M9Z7_9FLAO|nr:T9SS type A sorting domain-containing protein [Maribacter aurantiacus]TLF46355.1 T9SS type A sorting domain-containing protein [Maribacter aurantiacus]
MKRLLLLFSILLVPTWSYGQYTAIPDANFENALIAEGYDSEGGPADGQILTADVSDIQQLQLTGYNITNFQGLEAFSNLTAFTLTNNQSATLQEIDFSANLLLEEIIIVNVPNLPSVNISQNNLITNLTIVTRGNLFSTINLLGKSSITSLQLADNQITDIDLSGVPNLVDLSLAINPLTNVDVKSLSSLETLDTYESQITTLDLSQNTKLTRLNSDNGSLTFVNLQNGANNLLTSVELNGNTNLACIQVDDVTYSEQQTLLGNWVKDAATTYSENCGYTFIPDTNFELALIAQGIDSEGGPPNGLILTSDISSRLSLDISGQDISDLSGLEDFSSLEILNVSDNNLDELRLQNLSLVEIRANNCNLGGKPIRFQNSPPNGQFLTNVTRLELQNNGIGSPGSTISFGGVPNVTYLDISDNNFGTIQLNESTSIETLLANNCPNLTTLANLDALTNLESLNVSYANLPTLNVSQNIQLFILDVRGNSMTTLDLSNNNVIGSVYAGDNDLATISLPTTTTLSELFVENNVLSALDLSTVDQNLFDFDATGNPNLTCIQVSNLDFAQRAWSIDTGTSYSINCNLQPFTVTVSILGTTGNPPAIEITEGNSFTLNFDSGPTAPNDTQYTPNIQFTLNGNPGTEDFTFNGNATLPTTPFTVSSANPDGGITILAINDGVTEGDETYTITISSPDPSLFSIEGPTSFEVTIKDNISSEPPSLTLDTKVLGATTLGYDLEGEFPVELFEVVEGSSLEITLNDISSEGANGFPFSLPWSVSGITEDNVQLVDGDGNNLPFDNQELNFTVDTSNEFEIQINITLDDNEIFESNKEFTIQFKENGFDESLISIQNASNPSAPYRMRFTIVENDIEGRIITSLTNIGGRENSGIADKFEIALKYPDETYYKNNTGADIIIPIDFDNTDNQLANPIDFNDISPNPLPQSFIIKPNDSTAIIELTYLEEIDVNDLEPNYFNLILLPVTSPLDLVHPQDTFLIKVLDENSPFDIITDFIGNVQRRDFGGEDCCYFFQVEEGEDILFSFDAEKGVQDALPYLLNIEILNAEFSSNTSTRANYGDGSFTLNTNTLENIPRSVKIDQIDNFLNMRVEQGDYSSPKSFRISFSPPDNSNYEYVGPKDRDSSNETVSFDFEIIDAIPASIEATKATMNEEDPSDFVEVKIKLNTLEITNQEDISFSFILTKNSTATFGVDYRIESNNDFEIFEENISTKSKKGVIYLDSNSSPTEAVFRIIPINEPVGEEEPEGTETVIIELLDGFGYSIDNGNSFVEIDITDEDVGDYDVNLSVPNETLYEDSTRSPNSGVFEIQLFSNGNSASAAEDIKVYFEITNELDFAIEGDDYRIYDGNGPGKRDITNDLNKYVTIKKSESIGYIYVEVVTDDGEIEPNETVTINLKTGIGYNLNPENYTLSGSVNIISKEQNTENLNPSDLSAFVYSATCPEVSEGKIAMVNNSPFDFNVELFNNSQEVGSADLQNGIVTPLVLFEKLEAGNYTVKLQAKGRDDIYPPSFNLTIRENLNSTQLLSSMVNSEKKEASLKVSGSKFYEVIINDKSYNHRFENDGPQEFNLPLQIGKNSIQIRGETQCQGIIDHEIIFNEFKFFPNPTESIIHLDGLSSTNNLKLIFYDTTGKVVATFERLNQKSSNWVVNVESLSIGTYFCKIISEDKVINTLKLIKN